MRKSLVLIPLVFAFALPALAQFKAGEIQIFKRQKFAEATCSGAATGYSVLCSSSSAHALQVSNNNGSFADVLWNGYTGNVGIGASNSSDLITVKRGSFCKVGL